MQAIHRRLVGLMKRHGMFHAENTSNEEQQLEALAACGQLALTPWKRERSGPALSIVDEDEVERPRGTQSSLPLWALADPVEPDRPPTHAEDPFVAPSKAMAAASAPTGVLACPSGSRPCAGSPTLAISKN